MYLKNGVTKQTLGEEGEISVKNITVSVCLIDEMNMYGS